MGLQCLQIIDSRYNENLHNMLRAIIRHNKFVFASASSNLSPLQATHQTTRDSKDYAAMVTIGNATMKSPTILTEPLPDSDLALQDFVVAYGKILFIGITFSLIIAPIIAILSGAVYRATRRHVYPHDDEVAVTFSLFLVGPAIIHLFALVFVFITCLDDPRPLLSHLHLDFWKLLLATFVVYAINLGCFFFADKIHDAWQGCRRGKPHTNCGFLVSRMTDKKAIFVIRCTYFLTLSPLFHSSSPTHRGYDITYITSHLRPSRNQQPCIGIHCHHNASRSPLRAPVSLPVCFQGLHQLHRLPDPLLCQPLRIDPHDHTCHGTHPGASVVDAKKDARGLTYIVLFLTLSGNICLFHHLDLSRHDSVWVFSSRAYLFVSLHCLFRIAIRYIEIACESVARFVIGFTSGFKKGYNDAREQSS